jgi:hypothetical protein
MQPRYVYNEGGGFFELRIVAAVMVSKCFGLGGFVVNHDMQPIIAISLSFPLLTVVIFRVIFRVRVRVSRGVPLLMQW